MIYCLLAQSVEHAAVNRRVVSSSLTEAAKTIRPRKSGAFCRPLFPIHFGEFIHGNSRGHRQVQAVNLLGVADNHTLAKICVELLLALSLGLFFLLLQKVKVIDRYPAPTVAQAPGIIKSSSPFIVFPDCSCALIQHN